MMVPNGLRPAALRPRETLRLGDVQPTDTNSLTEATWGRKTIVTGDYPGFGQHLAQSNGQYPWYGLSILDCKKANP